MIDSYTPDQPYQHNPSEPKSSKPVDVKSIDPKVMAGLRRVPNLLESLDKWILFSERSLIPDMQALATVVQKLKPLPKDTIYRGFGNWSGQETLGFKTSNIFQGETGRAQGSDRAISFSTDVDIARSFGRIVVKCNNWDPKRALYICPELCTLVSERRNLPEVMTQEEVIILPPFDIACEVIEVRKTNWWHW